MDSYISFSDQYTGIGIETLQSVSHPIHRQILSSISTEDGGARLQFVPLDEAHFHQLTGCFSAPVPYGNESYLITIADVISIYYTSEITKIYALYALKRHYTSNGIPRGTIYSTPKVPFRCVRLYLPGKRRIRDFQDFIDMMLAFGHNTVDTGDQQIGNSRSKGLIVHIQLRCHRIDGHRRGAVDPRQ